jgi:hypothetical protein
VGTDVHVVLLFLLMCVLGGIGGAVGSMAGNVLGRGGVFVGGFAGGVALVFAAAYIAVGRGWIDRARRFWTVVGGVFGFVLAALVTLTTLSSPVGPIVSTLLIGTGAVLGARIGVSAHDKTLTPNRRVR